MGVGHSCTDHVWLSQDNGKSSSFAVWDLGIELGLLCFECKCLYLMNHLISPHDWFLMNVKLEKRCCV